MQATGVTARESAPTINAAIRSKFLAAKSPAQQQQIFQLTAAICQQLAGWSGRAHIFRPIDTVIQTVALNFAAAAPFASATALLPTVQLCLWEFILDDLLDDERMPQAELEQRVAQCRAALLHPLPRADADPLSAVLQEIRCDLQSYPLWSALAPWWTAAVVGLIDGMMGEYRWRAAYRQHGSVALPTYPAYIANGRYSVGYQPLVWTALLALNDASTPVHLAYLQAMEETGAICLRLANDLRTYTKEVAEGKFNALWLLDQEWRQQGLSPVAAYQRAEAQIQAEIDAGLARLTQWPRHPVTATGQPEAFIADVVRFACDFYTRHDYHNLNNPPQVSVSPEKEGER